jgi:hypothetical protein
MQPKPWPEAPAGTARVAKIAFRKGVLAIRARDQLGSWYEDGDFGPCTAPKCRHGSDLTLWGPGVRPDPIPCSAR